MLPNAVTLAADSSLTDSIIIERVLRGQIEEYEILVRRYNSMLYKTAHGILREEEDVEDAMQEAYIKGFKKLNQFKGDSKFSTWLTRILINCALKHVNQLKSKDFISLEDVDGPEIENNVEEFDITSKEQIDANLNKAMEIAINQLPAKYRIVFIMREVEQLPVVDVSASLGITVENVKIRLHRAKGLLKKILTPKLKSMAIFEFHAIRCRVIAEQVMGKIYSLAIELH